MFNKIISKIISNKAAALLCAVFLLAPAPSFAWTHVCMEFKFWKVWIDGKFQVVYGIDPQIEQTNYTYIRDHSRGQTWWSPTMRAGNKHCSSIHPIQTGENFAVYMLLGFNKPDEGIWCESHPSNPSAIYLQSDQTHRGYRKLWYQVTGTVWNPKCRFHHESW